MNNFHRHCSLPSFLWLWAPLLVAVSLVFAFHLLSQDAYETWIGSEETGLLEGAHAVIPFVSAAFALALLISKISRHLPLLRVICVVLIAGNIYIGGEEASWGQHWFGWETSDEWSAINDQGETNLHNTSSWLDQKPRALLEIGVIVGGLVFPIVGYFYPALWNWKLSFFYPSPQFFVTALIAEFSKNSERLLSALGSDFRLFNRASEVQETYFVWFLFLYVLLMYCRARRSHEGHQD